MRYIGAAIGAAIAAGWALAAVLVLMNYFPALVRARFFFHVGGFFVWIGLPILIAGVVAIVVAIFSFRAILAWYPVEPAQSDAHESGDRNSN